MGESLRGEPGRVVPGTYTPRTPTAVWLLNTSPPRPALLVAWRRQFGGDQRPYWFGLVIIARVFGEDVEMQTKWIWEAHIQLARPAEHDEKAPASR